MSSTTLPARVQWNSTDVAQARWYISTERIRKMWGNDPGDRNTSTLRRRAEALKTPEIAAGYFDRTLREIYDLPVYVSAHEDRGRPSHLTFTSPGTVNLSKFRHALERAARLPQNFGIDHRQRLPELVVVAGLRWPTEAPTLSYCKCSHTSTPHSEGTCAQCGHGHAHVGHYFPTAPLPLQAGRIAHARFEVRFDERAIERADQLHANTTLGYARKRQPAGHGPDA